MRLKELNPILDDHANILVVVNNGDDRESLHDLSGMDKVAFFDTNGDYIVDFITTWDVNHDYDFVIYVSKEVM
mgnify:FL=1